ncbi:MAG: isoleucine--tRNA ligase [Alphaproteobacteria bacterium]|jgi:isoleucyl-tRNA synthetase|nr:isoleucine--tRNA ligase [Alphaproteobacteria bacterium]
MEKDYKNSVILPKTDFPMRAGLAKKEPETLEKWAKMNLQKRMQEDFKDRPKFYLHDGPAYANGHIHMGHALNKTLKDAVNKYQQVIGKDASDYVVGFDCHGLPIEWKVMENYKTKGIEPEDVDTLEFRKVCREFATKYVGLQTDDSVRLGVFADWEKYYTTMDGVADSNIVKNIHKFLLSGSLYKGVKPVMWAIPERSALAEAEVEYLEHKSTTIWVRFTVKQTNCEAIDGADIVIWTTTPWTMPGNRAVACHPDFEYGVYEVKAVDDSQATAIAGDKLVLLKELAEATKISAGITEMEEIATVKGSDIVGSICSHPFAAEGEYYQFDVPVLEADFVTADTGTGFVHIAPGHGPDDYFLGLANKIEIPDTVGEDGKFLPHIPVFAGEPVYTAEGKEGTANGISIRTLFANRKLLAKGSVRHEYPHSWRSKSPVIFRTTPQWFISMEENGLRDKAMKEIDNVKWYPEQSINRIKSFVGNRPDWCISRQRKWGVPLSLFVNKETGEVLRDQEVCDRIAKAYAEGTSDVWFSTDKQEFLGDKYKLEDYDVINDLVDVWFDSGSTWSFVMESRNPKSFPCDLYLEGSDQHRGWFNSSMIVSVGNRGVSPFKACLTNGFTVDEKGLKMSKSGGNSVSPLKVMDEQGADILRTWAVNCDYCENTKIGRDILKQQSDVYRKIRNTLRFLLGNLNGYTSAEEVAFNDMPELEKWVLNRMTTLDAELREDTKTYNMKGAFEKTYNFCINELSSFYLDIRKDSLYCDSESDIKRRACRTVLNKLFDFLCIWLSPVISFTAEEAWGQRYGNDNDSVFLHAAAECPAEWRNEELEAKWNKIREVRKAITPQIELLRAEKTIGSSLQAKPIVKVYSEELFKTLSSVDMAEICITSTCELVEAELDGVEEKDFDIAIETASGDKCERCWKVLEEVGSQGEPICNRCKDALK